jgi:hypothetical protein
MRCVSNACSVACAQQSSGNLVPNAGFDQDLGGWEGDLGGEDVSNCPLSKSLLLVGTPGGEGSILPASLDSPCFSLPGGRTHSFGAAFKRSAGGKVACFLYVWPDSASCSANADNLMRIASVDDSLNDLGKWLREKTTVPAQAGQTYARVNCQADGKGLVDEVFVSANGGF